MDLAIEDEDIKAEAIDQHIYVPHTNPPPRATSTRKLLAPPPRAASSRFDSEFGQIEIAFGSLSAGESRVRLGG